MRIEYLLDDGEQTRRFRVLFPGADGWQYCHWRCGSWVTAKGITSGTRDDAIALMRLAAERVAAEADYYRSWK